MASKRYGKSSEEVRAPIKVLKEVVLDLVPPPSKQKVGFLVFVFFLCQDFRIKLEHYFIIQSCS